MHKVNIKTSCSAMRELLWPWELYDLPLEVFLFATLGHYRALIHARDEPAVRRELESSPNRPVGQHGRYSLGSPAARLPHLPVRVLLSWSLHLRLPI